MLRLNLNSFWRRQSPLRHHRWFSIKENGALFISEAVRMENEDISSMDRYMKIVQDRADPAYHNILPTRFPMLWADALASAASERLGDLGPTTLTMSATQIDLVPRKMQDSYSELVLAFGSSKEVFENYANAWGGLRTGKLMEHLDSLAGSIAYKHMLGPVQYVGDPAQHGFYIVTASVDRLDMLSPLNPTQDLRLSGHVIYTGRSSLEVAVRMESVDVNNPPQTVMIGRFSMVCRDSFTQKARQVNPLEVFSAEENALYDLGKQTKQRREYRASRSLERVPPSSSEAAALHAFYLLHGEGHGSVDRVWMGDATQERSMLMFPQERNIHGKIFGGYLMRQAYELGFTNASMFTRGRVRFLSSDGISFQHPVPIGSILLLRSQILHTCASCDAQLVHVGVKAKVVDVNTGHEKITNDFRFTWCQDVSIGNPLLRPVVPKSYKEAILWLEGKRALELGNNIRGSRSR